jgi:hypothetical protein
MKTGNRLTRLRMNQTQERVRAEIIRHEMKRFQEALSVCFPTPPFEMSPLGPESVKSSEKPS